MNTFKTLQDEFQSFLKRPEHQPMMEALQRKQIMRGIKAQEIHNAKEFRAKVASQMAGFLVTQFRHSCGHAECAPFKHLTFLRLQHVMQVLDADKHAQSDITPYLKIPALRPIIKTFTNDKDGDFGKWASNPQVLAMLKQAKQLLDDGHMTQEELLRAFQGELEVTCTPFAKQPVLGVFTAALCGTAASQFLGHDQHGTGDAEDASMLQATAQKENKGQAPAKATKVMRLAMEELVSALNEHVRPS